MFADIHAHLLDSAFDETREIIIRDLSSKGVSFIVENSTCPEDMIRASELAEKNSNIYAAVGIYPDFSFMYNRDVESVIKYNGWICQLASLFYGNDINYTGGQIDFEGRRTVIYKIMSTSTLKSRDTLLYFNGLHEIHQFINVVSFESFKIHSKKLIRIIERFVQSLYLDGSTRYLALYNIFELCKSTYKKDKPKKDNNENPIVNAILQQISDSLKKGYDNAIKGIEDQSIQRKITIQYNAAKSALYREPTGQGMESFIEQFFDTNKIRYYTKKDIFKLRNAIMHGDSMNITNEINDVVEHIGIILILKLLGCPIQVNDALGYSDIYKEH